MKALVISITIICSLFSQVSPAFAQSDPAASPAPEITNQHAFGNPAGCAAQAPASDSASRLANVQASLGESINLAERRETYTWNAPLGTFIDISNDPYAYEFTINEYQHPLTYRADQLVTVFLNHGFVVWLRAYNNSFRLLAIPMTPGVLESPWGNYVTSYWMENGLPGDEFIYPVMKKLPCHWVIEAGYVDDATLTSMFSLPWQVPGYLQAGRNYLADNCAEANRVSVEKIGYRDASSVCGPLTWSIMRDANAFPYRIGSWTAGAGAFTGANPKWNGQPWGTFDPETFDLFRTESSLPGYDFAENGNLYPGDIVYSYASLYTIAGSGWFDHIFLVAGVNEQGTRLSISNMVDTYRDCSIQEVELYTPGDRKNGVINHEWNGFGYGKTGTSGFDVFRWKWITHQINGQPAQYTVRWGDTLETIGFDWKISPQRLAETNQLSLTSQLTPGQVITLPAP